MVLPVTPLAQNGTLGEGKAGYEYMLRILLRAQGRRISCALAPTLGCRLTRTSNGD